MNNLKLPEVGVFNINILPPFRKNSGLLYLEIKTEFVYLFF